MAKKSSMERVAEAAEATGLEITILTMPDSTRTAEEAANACKCEVGQIVKSLIFQREDTEEFVLLLVAGDRQADLEAAATVVGGPLTRADAKRVRKETGFAIGGVAPIGHMCPVAVYMDPALLNHEIVWAAAGAPNAVFSVCPAKLKAAVGAAVLA
ncbi:YbaK/EbsC family protein [Pseudovibrio exalbescens]|uniref:YbaK/EbsC family protein n=1 Tax=Pseudovibrio exalbescens TaxID=197461 RepID=UPI0023670FFB|nr:YbaK/EbsC family protein [Pseudovibrio exalbescens]MDD7910931.1 YbaK/EbsC family protein [Pseudovibrio exalbescens]